MIPPAGWRPDLVALDIDGTICAEGAHPLLSHTTISPGVRAALTAVLRSGVHVVLSTGRPVLSVLPFLTELDLSAGIAICSNGAVWIDAATGRIVDRITFDLAEPVAVLRELLPGAVFIAEEAGVGDRTTGHTDMRPEISSTERRVDFSELVSTPTTRLTVHWRGRTSAELAAVLASTPTPWMQYAISLDGPWMVATPPGVTKASALEKLRVQLGAPASGTLAVGDGVNDLEMLAWAAHGVAMGHAPDVVRAVADEVCPPVGEDGLATLLTRWF
ncbi:HAD-IIB family hydrolase [Nocardia sp. R6R-6]|uniref:HAD-IIB family hydrolase n=1 Tax=Nocardia sp. R6R-6 TaxID=3459303 RepID=UPI00403E05E8